MRSSLSRMPAIDACKAIACILIVMHHLAFYGPMSDVAYVMLPQTIDWLYQYGRIAVQVFIVVAGFLLAAKLAPDGRSHVSHPIDEIRKRYMRLVLPYLAALTLSILAAAIAPHWMTHASIPAEPELLQLIAHVLLLQGLLGQDSLSAGVWYVAIDFQLFSFTVLLLWLASRWQARHARLTSLVPVLIVTLMVASLFVFNRDARWSDTALYFFGAYGLGVTGYWASSRRHGMLWLGLLAMLVAAALLVDFRLRIAVAGSMMLILGIARTYGVLERLAVPQGLAWLGRISYSVFLVHFPVCLLVNAAFSRFLPQQPILALWGMVVALCASVATGALFFRWIENPAPTTTMRIMLPAGFAASALLAANVNW